MTTEHLFDYVRSAIPGAPGATVELWANLAAKDFSMRTRIVRRSANLPVDEVVHEAPADAIAVDEVWWVNDAGTYFRVDPMGARDGRRRGYNADQLYYQVEGRYDGVVEINVGVYSAGTLTAKNTGTTFVLRYNADSPGLIDFDDEEQLVETATLIPERYHEALAFRVLEQLYAIKGTEQDMLTSRYYFSRYTDLVDLARREANLRGDGTPIRPVTNFY